MSAHSLCGKISPAVSDRLNDGEMLRDLLLPRGPIDHASLIDQCLDRMTLDVDSCLTMSASKPLPHAGARSPWNCRPRAVKVATSLGLLINLRCWVTLLPSISNWTYRKTENPILGNGERPGRGLG
jgi:hypothetical protein